MTWSPVSLRRRHPEDNSLRDWLASGDLQPAMPTDAPSSGADAVSSDSAAGASLSEPAVDASLAEPAADAASSDPVGTLEPVDADQRFLLEPLSLVEPVETPWSRRPSPRCW